MTVAISHKEQLGYIKEVTRGTTPASALQALPYTKITDTPKKTTIVSAQNTANAEIADIVQVEQGADLGFDSELTFGALDDIMGSLFAASWATNVLKVGTTRQALTMERAFTDIGRFQTYKGWQASELDIDVALGKIMTASVKGSSNPMISASATAGAGAYTAVGTNAVMDPINSIQLIQEGGSGSVAGATELQLKITRGIINQPQLANVNPLDILPGQFMLEGSIMLYFQDDTYTAKFLAHTLTSLAFTFGGVSSLKYAFAIAKAYITELGNPNPGPNNSISQKLGWKARVDATDTTLKITRTP
jgi:hypothetical protein